MLKQVVIQSISCEEKISKNNKPYIMCGIKIADEWHNGFGKKEMKEWEAGQTVWLDIYEEEYQGKMYKKFKAVDKVDLLEMRVKQLEIYLKSTIKELRELKAGKLASTDIGTVNPPADGNFQDDNIPIDLPF